MIKLNRKIVHSFAQILLVVVLFMALLIVPATAQPQQHKIIFVLGTDENQDYLNNVSASTTIEVEIYNSSQARSKDFSNESIVFLASLDDETVLSINKTINPNAHVFTYNLTSNINIENIEDANITNYWISGSDANMLQLITYLGAKFYDLQQIEILVILLYGK